MERMDPPASLAAGMVLLDAVGESIPGIFFILDEPGRFLHGSKNLQRMTGLSEDRLRAARAIEIIEDGDRDLVARGIQDAHEKGRAAMAAQVRTQNGRKVPFLLTAISVFLDGRRCLVVTGFDRTEQKQAEEALRGSESRHRETYENALEGMFQTTLDGKFVNANPAMARILGYASVSELMSCVKDIGSQIYSNPEDRRRLIEQVRAQGAVRHREVELRRKDGESVWILLNHWLVPMPDGEPDLLEGFIIDISERKRAEAELRRSEGEYRLLYNQFQGILNAIPDAMCLISRDLRIIWANDVAAANMGMNMSEFLGKRCYESRHKISVPCENCIVLQSYASGKPIAGEGTTTDGRIWELHALPVLGDRGEVTGVIEAARDITERKKAEAEQAKLQAQFAHAQKMESVGRLAGGVAHDFNNMLTVILGQTEMALQQVNPGQPLYAELHSIRRAAEHSAGLTRQLLAFARKQTVTPKVLDLNEVVEGMLKMMRRLIGEDIDLAWLPAKKLWPVKIDPSQLDQILANLCVNARDAIGDTGKVTIETGNISIDDACCSANAGFVPGDFIVLTFSDNGCGMDAETASRLFEPFFTTKEQGKGTGLGLATVYGIVKQNQGFVDVCSEPGKGSAFKIYLPRAAAKPGSALTAENAVKKPSGHGTILVVEDEPTILSVVRTMLENHGFSVLAAANPDKALRIGAAHKGEIRLLLTDVVMPGMNGRELVTRLREFQPKLEPLFMSGYTANIIAHHGVLDDGVHFIAKPFTSADLIAKVEEALSERPVRGSD